MANDRWADAKNLLCVRLDALGDVLLTTPAMRALKESSQDRRISLLTSAVGSRAAEFVPEIDKVLTYAAPWMKATAPRANAHFDFKLIDRLRRNQFDAAVIFTVYSQNPLPAALTCYLAEIPLRLAHCRENPYQLLTDWIPEIEPEKTTRHEVRRQLDLVAAIGSRTSDERLSLTIPSSASDAASEALVAAGVDLTAPWLLIHPGATAPSRRYPPEKFAQVADLLRGRWDIQPVFTGTSGEEPLIDEICNAITHPAYSLAATLDFGQFAAAVRMAPVLISNNSGPVHVAAAVGTPVVDLYALTNPQHSPWRVPHRVLSFDVPCKYCYKSVCPEGHHDCLRRIEPEAVVAAALELLETPARNDRPGNEALITLEGND
jgi:lipopolysaccharide heptosyltransferase II